MEARKLCEKLSQIHRITLNGRSDLQNKSINTIFKQKCQKSTGTSFSNLNISIVFPVFHNGNLWLFVVCYMLTCVTWASGNNNSWHLKQVSDILYTEQSKYLSDLLIRKIIVGFSLFQYSYDGIIPPCPSLSVCNFVKIELNIKCAQYKLKQITK